MYKRALLFFLSLVLALHGAFGITRGGVTADGLKTIYAKALDDHECHSSEWHFVITQIDSPELAPNSISVSWENGTVATVSLEKVTGGVAHYTTTANLDSPVIEASAQIYESWNGQFNLSHGPCHKPLPTPLPPTETPTVPPTETPVVPPTETPVVPPTETAPPPTETVPPPTETAPPPTETPVPVKTPVPPTGVSLPYAPLPLAGVESLIGLVGMLISLGGKRKK